MKSNSSILIKLLVLQCLAVVCLSQSFDFFYFVQQISDLLSRLEKDWPTLACPSGDGIKFWGHEWSKHGTCSESLLDQYSYFQKALDLKAKANLLQALQTAGIYYSYAFSSLICFI
ncbi:hypothetical protein RHGRI_033960 [Rhododendron griersonianum]|uniref:Uncharacterized protein n=1 Tax=Rhododendron griersonianum TaxID=479676 RepID=A0AAV6I212_9ERIC|nr:hypothetical protein RHGRI_033960 [Rhododendron griersonianum]